MTSVPTISITTPDLESKDYMASGTVTPTTPDSPTVFDVVKELENKEPYIEDEALDLSEANATPQKYGVRSAIDSDDDEREEPKTIKNFYNQKSILITGASGFIGKALLWKLMQSLGQSFDKIFVLLRKTRQHQRSARDRLQDDILSNKAFVSLRRSMGSTMFDQVVQEKIYPIFGDLTEPNIGLSGQDLDDILNQANVIFHCAGSMDGTEQVDAAVKVNTFGTLQLLTLANQCHSIDAFIYLSNLQQINGNGWKTADEKYLYPLSTDAKNATDILTEIMAEGSQYAGFRPLYSNPYLFSKSLAEHVLVDQVIRNKAIGSYQFPIGIMRLSPVGPSVQEPLIGWADGVNGINGTILLTGRGNKVIQPHLGDGVADVVPVDYVARLIIGCAATLTQSEQFEVPKISSVPDLKQHNVEEYTQPTEPIRSHKRTSSQASRISIRSSTMYQNHQTPRMSLPGHQEQVEHTVPAIFQVSISNMRPVTWRVGYEAIRQYWIKATSVTLAPSKSYFNAPQRSSTMNSMTSTASPGLSRARTVMNSLRGYYMNPVAETASNHVVNVTPSASQSSDRINGAPSSVNSKRNSHRLSRTVDKAAKLSHTMKDSIYSTSGSLTNNQSINENTANLIFAVRNIDVGMEFDPSVIVPEDADGKFWVNYLTNCSYGIHYFVCQETNLRLPTPVYGWSCAIQPIDSAVGDEDGGYYQHVFERQVNSAIYSQDQISQRTARMVAHIKGLLMHNTPLASSTNKEKDDAWLTDLDDSLDDWCQDNDMAAADKDRRMALGKWRKKVGSNDESVKVIVLNDKRVNQAITQITQNAGVPKQTAVNEAMKILLRMSERTQLAFVWFTGSFLKSLLDDMFDNVRISDESLRAIRQSTMGKRVVYVPVSKSMLDPLLVWYIAIRYHLPVPALACDESMSQMGPISDVYRLAGAYYVKRDKSKRSPLNSAVTAAYTQVLLREHGALSFCLERSRSRTGKFQESYPDGFVDMIIEATLQTNQTSRSATNTASVINRIVSSEINTPPASPDSPSSSVMASPTMSIDSLAHNFVPTQQQQNRKVHKDVVFVPINITYENVPELSHLIDEVLDQQPARPTTGRARSSSQSSMNSGRPGGVVRPSEAKDRRKTLLDGLETQKKCGRVTFGIGPLVSVQEIAEECNREYTGENGETYESVLVSNITNRIHESQCTGLVVSPVSIISAIILYGRATNGVCVGKIKELMEWLRHEMVRSGYTVDWQEGEDLDSLILTSFKLLNEPKNLIVDGREFNDDTNVKVNDHADNVMALSYYANQMIDIFLLDAFFSVVYLSFLEDSVLEDEFMDRFRFLLQLLEREFVLDWNMEIKFEAMISSYVRKQIIRVHDNRLLLLVNLENDPIRYEQLVFLASLVYPTVDAYWITSCSLSALEAVPMLPRCIIPLLTQWIATHLITGRRTIYREVLSTESSRTAVDVFMSMGFLTEIQAKEKLSPDAQILLHELGIPTSEVLIELSGQNNDGGSKRVSPVDPEGMMKAVMAQIQMNRANSNMADLCQQIDSYRLGSASKRESFQNAQVFQKCLKQIKGILQANSSFAKRRNVVLPEDEDGLAQLVYSLLASSVPVGDRAAQARALRRISEAYNLR
ncbi:male sterility protein-domain-containing protein [Mucor mucedo]|uniref:male sterility protein-domain-containing protein n=1 Tax=Mucor mucedo TaxID=29922 RepID=UPI0022206B13|nr:male sterility protein-domain-containing protein [Mucor mucedo]KAI7896859.1 male sterility protein-domain-containing protein [Mucor mucedo]